MYTKPKSCSVCHASTGRWWKKKGYFKTKHNYQPVPRYECLSCGKGFSASTQKQTYRQHRPDLNKTIFKLYASGMTQRRMARVLDIDPKTVQRKFLLLAKLSKEAHQKRLESGQIKVSSVEFDEMESFEHTRLKPLTIAVAVDDSSGLILEMRAARIPAKGPTAKLSQKLYGQQPNNKIAACAETLMSVGKCLIGSDCKIKTDGSRYYRTYVPKFLPKATHIPINNIKKKNRNLFTLNYTAAKIRNDLSRMRRKTWVTTKKLENLQAHLDLYIAYNNGYKIL